MRPIVHVATETPWQQQNQVHLSELIAKATKAYGDNQRRKFSKSSENLEAEVEIIHRKVNSRSIKTHESLGVRIKTRKEMLL